MYRKKEYGKPSAAYKLVTSLYILYTRKGTNLVHTTLFVTSSLQGKIWVENPQSKETVVTKPIPSKERKEWSDLISRKSYESEEMNADDLSLWAVTAALFSKQCTNCCHHLASALQ